MKLKKYLAILFLATSFTACDETSFLEENPLDFYSPENSLETLAHFNASLNYLYNKVRHIQHGMNIDTRMAFQYATDFALMQQIIINLPD